MTVQELARVVLDTDLSEEGYCAHCERKVGNWHPANDERHASWCIVLKLREATKP